MPSNQTANYALSQWERTDQVRMEDFNADNEKLDAALAAQAETLAAHTQALSRLGNCQVYATTYTGHGRYGKDNPTTLTFPRKPMLVVITGTNYGATIIIPQDCGHAMHLEGNIGSCYVTWRGNTLSWFSPESCLLQMSDTQPYRVIAFFAMD